MVKAITKLGELDSEFREAGDKYVVVDFHASWCGPCKQIAPKIEEWAKKYSDKVVALKVDVDEAEDIAVKYAIEAMPTFILFRHGEQVDKVVGANSEKILGLFTKP